MVPLWCIPWIASRHCNLQLSSLGKMSGVTEVNEFQNSIICAFLKDQNILRLNVSMHNTFQWISSDSDSNKSRIALIECITRIPSAMSAHSLSLSYKIRSFPFPLLMNLARSPLLDFFNTITGHTSLGREKSQHMPSMVTMFGCLRIEGWANVDNSAISGRRDALFLFCGGKRHLNAKSTSWFASDSRM